MHTENGLATVLHNMHSQKPLLCKIITSRIIKAIEQGLSLPVCILKMQAYKTYSDSGCGEISGFLRGVVPSMETLFVED